MKNYSLILSIFSVSLILSCTSAERNENTEEWSDDQASEWFDQKEWLGETDLQPDGSINKKEFAVNYHRNKDRWDKALDFLKNKEYVDMEVGRHEVDGKNVYALISEYNSKNHEDTQYEAHEKYTDIHYVISGTENIGLTDLSTVTVKTPYNAENDITFYNGPEGEKLNAHQDNFFIFFPQDAHRPGMKVDNNVPVKKMVIKVRYQ